MAPPSSPPNVLVNQDTAGAPQNETAIAVDPNNPNRIVGGANDYVTRTWSCFVDGTPCSGLGDGYSGTYYSNDGGSTWCCNSNPNSNYIPTTDPAQIGTLIPGVEHLVGGQYDAGGDPSFGVRQPGPRVLCGSWLQPNQSPNTVTVNKGTFDGSGHLSWSAPTFINQTTAPSILNDKEWIAVDSHPGSPFQDRIYVSWTRFKFQAGNRCLCAVTDLLCLFDRRRRDLQRAEEHRGQRALRSGVPPSRRTRRDSVRILERFDPPRIAQLDLRGQVHRRRRYLEQTHRGRDRDEHPRGAQHCVSGEQLSSSGGCSER